MKRPYRTWNNKECSVILHYIKISKSKVEAFKSAGAVLKISPTLISRAYYSKGTKLHTARMKYKKDIPKKLGFWKRLIIFLKYGK